MGTRERPRRNSFLAVTRRTQRAEKLPEPPKPPTDTPNAVTGRWELVFDGEHPTRPNQSMRGSYGGPEKQAKLRRLRLALQGAAEQWRKRTAMHVLAAGIPACQRVRVSAVFVRRALNVADEDGDRGALKPIIDGLVQAHVIPDDTRRYLEWGTVTEEKGPRGLKLLIERLA